MPYSLDNLPPPAEKLTLEQKEKYAEIFNALLKEGIDEDKILPIALSRAKEPGKYRNQRKDMAEEQDFFEEQWVQVFSVGTQTDSSGRSRDWTQEDLETIVAKYNGQKEHEAPVVVGHPKDNAPAFGWVEKLRTDGKLLYAKFTQLVPEFIDAVKQGMYKKRSISLYPDLTLRHIGFLGAVPPAVKGLADIKFNEEDVILLNYSGSEDVLKIESKGDKNMSDELKTVVAELQKKVDSFGEQVKTLETVNTDLQKKNEELQAKVDDKQFEESTSEDIKELKSKLALAEQKNRLAGYKAFTEELKTDGKIVAESQNLLIDLMEAMNAAPEFNFSEGEEKSVLVKFQEYLKNQPKIVAFGEVSTDAAKDVVNEKASDKLGRMAREYAEANKVSYTAALINVQESNPDLAVQASSEIA